MRTSSTRSGPGIVLSAVPDANVLVSGLMFPGGAPARVLASEKFSLHPDRVLQMILTLLEVVEVVEPCSRVGAIKAEDSDNRILECALDAGVDVIITGNMRHIRPLKRFRGIDILTPAEFLSRFGAGDA